MNEPESSRPPLPHGAMTAVDLRSPSDAELSAFLPWFAPSHAHFGELTYTLALAGTARRTRYGADLLRQESRARSAAAVAHAPIRHVNFAKNSCGGLRRGNPDNRHHAAD